MVGGGALRSGCDGGRGTSVAELRGIGDRRWLRMRIGLSADGNRRAILRGLVHAAHFDVGRDGMEDMLGRDEVSGMGRLADVTAVMERNVVIIAGDDALIWRHDQFDAGGYVKRADPEGSGAMQRRVIVERRAPGGGMPSPSPGGTEPDRLPEAEVVGGDERFAGAHE